MYVLKGGGGDRKSFTSAQPYLFFIQQAVVLENCKNAKDEFENCLVQMSSLGPSLGLACSKISLRPPSKSVKALNMQKSESNLKISLHRRAFPLLNPDSERQNQYVFMRIRIQSKTSVFDNHSTFFVLFYKSDSFSNFQKSNCFFLLARPEMSP